MNEKKSVKVIAMQDEITQKFINKLTTQMRESVKKETRLLQKYATAQV